MDKSISLNESAIPPTPNAVQRGVESASAAMHDGIDRLANPVRSSVEDLSATAHQKVNALAGGAGHVADRFADETRKIAEAPRKALDYSKTRVQDRPLEAVGIALAVGFIIGRLTAR